jgi:SAM-dependent methyltransferase
MRPLVYYLREDFIPPAMASGRDVLDFSAGLGDLSQYLVESGARSVTATVPDVGTPPVASSIRWLEGVDAGNITERLAVSSFDLVAARMVLQFPTWEGDRADPDTMVRQFGEVLRTGGRLVIAFHQFRAFEPVPATGDLPHAVGALDNAGGDAAHLARVVRYLGLPPREGPMGEFGFGLKIPMLVTTLQTYGFDIEIADDPEPFTFPLDLEGWDEERIIDLGRRVMDLKHRYLADPEQSPYDRPQIVRRMLTELSGLMEFAVWPIARVVARLRS